MNENRLKQTESKLRADKFPDEQKGILAAPTRNWRISDYTSYPIQCDYDTFAPRKAQK